MRQIQLELSWQPLFGGGVRGLGYFSVLEMPMDEVWYVLDWSAKRHNAEVKAFNKGKG